LAASQLPTSSGFQLGGQWQITDVGGSGSNVPLPPTTTPTSPDMVVGDQGIYFATQGDQVIAVNESDGNQ
jgi:hypothetical protein